MSGEQKSPPGGGPFLRCVAFSIIDYREPFPPSSILRTRRPVFKRRERGGQSRGHAKHARPHRDVQENRHSECPLVTSSSVMNTPVNPPDTISSRRVNSRRRNIFRVMRGTFLIC